MTRYELCMMPYTKYCRTAHWKRVLAAVTVKFQGRCVLCNRDGVQGHHRSYSHRGDFEQEVNDVVLLCKRCHLLFEKSNIEIQPDRFRLGDLIYDPQTDSYSQK